MSHIYLDVSSNFKLDADGECLFGILHSSTIFFLVFAW